MPDISMCNSQTCRLASRCYRNPKSGTVPTPQRQSWMEFLADTDQEPCIYFWERGQ